MALQSAANYQDVLKLKKLVDSITSEQLLSFLLKRLLILN